MSKEMEKIGEVSGIVNPGGYGPHVRIDDFTSFVHKAEEEGYWAEVPALPGCLTQGETLDEVVENLNDAIEGWLSVQTLELLKANGVRFTILAEADAAASPVPMPRVHTLELAA